MKIMKKLATLLLAICLSVPCFTMSAYAADGSIQFTDPSTAVGETVEVTCAVKASDTIGNADINLSYDASMLKFKSGENITETEAGQLSYRGKGSSNELRFNITFEVLKEGTTTIDVTAYNTFLASDEPLTCQKGSSTITIAEGTAPAPTEEPEAPATTEENEVKKVTVDGKEYELSEIFVEADIPEGFAETTIEYDGAQYKVVQQESSGIVLGYLTDENKIGKFFMYDAEDATFSPFEQIKISDSTVITLLTNKTKLNLPKEYQKVTLTLNEQDFPAWQNSEKDGYYVVYAISDQGEKSLYQFDSQEGTYQRFEVPKVEQVKKDRSLLGRLSSVLEKHLDYVILGTGLGSVFFVVLVVVLGVKLHNRNAELDELYEEYDIDADEEEDEEEEVQPKEKKGLFGRRKKVEEEDDFEEEETLDFEEEAVEETVEEIEEFEEEAAWDAEEEFVEDLEDESDDFDENADAEDDLEEEFTAFDEEDFEDVDFEEEDFDFDFGEDEKEFSIGKRLSTYEDFDVDFIDLED